MNLDTFCALQRDRIQHLTCSGGKVSWHSHTPKGANFASPTPADNSKNWRLIEYRMQLLRLAGGTGEQAIAARKLLKLSKREVIEAREPE